MFIKKKRKRHYASKYYVSLVLVYLREDRLSSNLVGSKNQTELKTTHSVYFIPEFKR